MNNTMDVWTTDIDSQIPDLGHSDWILAMDPQTSDIDLVVTVNLFH